MLSRFPQLEQMYDDRKKFTSLKRHLTKVFVFLFFSVQPVGDQEIFSLTENLPLISEAVFVNVYGTHESIPRNRFCQPM
jgi:hypothetical protein